MIERFFDTRINAFVGHPIAKWVIIIVSIAWYVVAIILTT